MNNSHISHLSSFISPPWGSRWGVALSTLVFSFFLMGCQGEQANDKWPDGLTVDALLPMTPVKNQTQNPFCWLFAPLATIETEHLAQGDSVNLSVRYLARMFLYEQGMRYYSGSSKGREISLRGTMPMCLQLLSRYGIQPYDYYERNQIEEPNFKVLARKVMKAADICRARRESETEFERQLNELLDKETGYLVRYVHMLGAEYTSREFAHSVCRPNEYVMLTTTDSHPYNQWVDLHLTDNQWGDRFYNVPQDTLMQYIVRALRSGHPVGWEGGLHGQRTDDHCMTIIGLAHTQQNRYFIFKNSLGTEYGKDGLVCLSYNYVRNNTIAIMITRDIMRVVK